MDRENGRSIPDHALPRFQGNPVDNFNVNSPVPENLRGYWTKEHQSPRWEGDTNGDIWTQENRLWKVITGYAARATRFMTTYEYQAPHGLNHGLSHFYDEVTEYLVPPMVEDASALLGDFVTLYQEREVHKKKLAHLEQQTRMTQSETDIETNILRAQMAGLWQGAECAHQERASGWRSRYERPVSERKRPRIFPREACGTSQGFGLLQRSGGEVGEGVGSPEEVVRSSCTTGCPCLSESRSSEL